MKIFEEKVVTQQTMVQAQCDHCKQRVSASSEFSLPEGWLHFVMREDEYPQYRTSDEFHVCSIGCFAKVIIDNYERFTGYKTGEACEMPIEFAKLVADAIIKTLPEEEIKPAMAE